MIENIFKVPILILIHLYRNTISLTFGPCCRFYPSCSAYALESISRFGTMKGVWITIKRVIRCHPFNPGGYDPVSYAIHSENKKEGLLENI